MLMTFPSCGRSSARRRSLSGESWLVCMWGTLPRTPDSSHGGRMRRMGGLTKRQTIFLAGVALITIVAGVMHYGDASPTATWIVCGAALAGVAWIVAFATEQVGTRFGPAVTGVLQSTLGNLPEFFIV